MTTGFRDDSFTVEIVEHLGVIGDADKPYQKEVNIVSWNRKEPKVDIRSWDESHEHMSKGVTLTDEEARNLYEVLKARYEK